MEYNRTQIVINICIFLFIIYLLLIISVYSYTFYDNLDIHRKGFLDLEHLKQLGFWDVSDSKYEGYWYPNGHLHPLYVFSTSLFEKCYNINILICIIIGLYVMVKSKFKINIPYSSIILVVTLFAFIINFVAFCFAGYYYLSCDKVFPTDINFLIFLGNIIIYITIIIFYFRQRKNTTLFIIKNNNRT